VFYPDDAAATAAFQPPVTRRGMSKRFWRGAVTPSQNNVTRRNKIGLNDDAIDA
jgi:hypothetical protein